MEGRLMNLFQELLGREDLVGNIPGDGDIGEIRRQGYLRSFRVDHEIDLYFQESTPS
jgi:hypothetical protein